jgi:hypothetical protein
VLPFASAPSPGRLLPSREGAASLVRGLDLTLQTRMQTLAGVPVRDSTAKAPLRDWARLDYGGVFNVENLSGQENRWHHHDRLTRTGNLGGSRACSLRSDGRLEEPPVSNDLALDFPTATGKQNAGCSKGGRVSSKPEVNRRLRTTQASQKGQALSAGRQPSVLVLDDPGGDRSRIRNRGANDRRERDRPRARTLRYVSIHASARPERAIHTVAAQKL